MRVLDVAKPCEHCPWVEKGQPQIMPEVRQAAERGDWFCCHVHMGMCTGAELIRRKFVLDTPGRRE